MSTSKIREIDYVILLLILMIAILARVIKLDSSLWYDEIITVVDFIRLPIVDLLTSHSSFNNHPFYSLQANVSVLLFGESTWSVRLPAVFFGIASIAAMWRLAYSVTGMLQAHTTAFLIALSYHHVWFSQNARGYTELMFWCVVSIIVLIDCLRNPSWKGWILYSLIIAAGIYTHLTASFFFLAQGLFVIVAILCRKGPYFPATFASGKDKWLMPMTGFLIGGILNLLLYLPSIAHLFESVLDVPNTSSVDVMKEYQNPIWTILEIIRSIGQPNFLTILAAFVSIILTGIGIYSILKKEPLLPIVFILHITIMIAFLMALSMRIWPRFFFNDMGFILLFITQGVFICSQKIAQFFEKHLSLTYKEQHLFILASFLMIAISCVLIQKNYQFPKQNFESPIKYINKRKLQTDKIVALGLAAVPYNKYYKMNWRAIETIDELKKTEADATNTWLVMIFPTRTTRDFVDIMNHVEKNFILNKTFRGTLGDGDILIYLSNNQV